MISLDWSLWTALRFVGASLTLWLCYYLLFDRKAPFNQCRIYLLYSVLLAGVVSVVRVPVYPVETSPLVVVNQTVAPPQTETNAAPFIAVEETGIQPKQLTTTKSEGTEEFVPQPRKEYFYESWDYWLLAWCVYGLVAVVLLIHLTVEMARIWRLRRWGSCTTDTDGIRVVRDSHVISPFSFYRTVFINRKIEGNVLRIVLLHEKAHIHHHHYRDTFLIEFLCILCWFNPFVWLIKRELRALHKFQVDRDMLSGEIELVSYQQILFEELMGYSPNIANGFHNSLIKKRFIMMKYQYNERFVWLRKAALILLFVGIPALFSFTGRPVFTEVAQAAAPQKRQALTAMGKQEQSDATTDNRKEKETNQLLENTAALITKKEDALLKNKIKEGEPQVIVSDKTNEVDLRPDQTVASRAPRVRNAFVRFIEQTENDTRVTIAVPVYYDRHWVQFEKGMSIVDESTNTIYRIRSLTRDIELNKTYWIVGMNQRMAEFTLVFPPLDKKVKLISIRNCFPEEGIKSPPRGGSWNLNNLRVDELAPTPARLEEYDSQGRPRHADAPVEVTLTANQLPISAYEDGQTRIMKITTSPESTQIVLSVPIHHDRHWVSIGKGFCIVDSKTGDTYPIQGVANGIELNKLLWVEGCKERSVLFTLIFPGLKNKTKTIDLYNKYPDANTITPANGSDWMWRNIKIKDYQSEDYKKIVL